MLGRCIRRNFPLTLICAIYFHNSCTALCRCGHRHASTDLRPISISNPAQERHTHSVVALTYLPAVTNETPFISMSALLHHMAPLYSLMLGPSNQHDQHLSRRHANLLSRGWASGGPYLGLYFLIQRGFLADASPLAVLFAVPEEAAL